jgi:signal transduction histidine kinase/streptogramin lyase
VLAGVLLAAYSRALASSPNFDESGKRWRTPLPWLVLLTTAICICCASGSAQDWERTITQFQHTAWGPKEGAPDQIRVLAQTRDGYLWLGAADGLYRFDGVIFERYQPPSGASLPADRVYSLLALPGGELWVGFSDRISLLKEGRVKNYTNQEGVPAGRVVGFAQDREGTLWAATRGGLARLEEDRWKKVEKDWNFPGISAQALLVDRQGTLWIIADNEVVFLPPGTKTFHSTNVRVGQALQIVQAPDGTLWMAETTRSVRTITVDGEMTPSQAPEIRVGSMGILFDPDGSMWVTTIGDGLRRVSHPELLRGKPGRFSPALESFTAKDGLTDDFAMAVLEDSEGNIWVGTHNGLDRFRKTNLVPVVLPVPLRHALIVAGRDGDVWVRDINLWGRIRGARFDKPSSATSTQLYFNNVSRTAAGDIWWVGNTALLRFENNHFTHFPMPQALTNRPSDRLRLTEDGLGGIWVSAIGEGLYHLKGGVWTRLDTPPHITILTPAAAYTDWMGRAWFGYQQGAIIVVENGTIRTLVAVGNSPVGSVYTIQGRDRHIWIGGDSGLALFDGSRFRSVVPADTADFGAVCGVEETNKGDLLLADSRGVIRIDSSEVQKFLQDASYRVRYEVFDSTDGLPGMLQDHAQNRAEAQGTDGRIWFATSNGLAWLDPAQISRNSVPPPVSIRSLTADGKRHPETNATLPALTRNLQIQFTALSLSAPERVRFRYKLDGLDKDWQDAGTRREAFYTNLGPGNYRFHVIACNNDGVWNETGATLDFAMLPAWYQTIWFRSVCVIAFLLLLWALHHLRLRFLKRQFHRTLETRVAERTRIAHELHDTLLQEVLSASMQLNVANDQLSNDSPVKPLVERVLTLMGRVIDGSRKAVGGLRPSNDDVQALEQALAAVPQELGFEGATDYRLIVEGTPRALNPLVRDEVYRIGCEAIVNAFRHSGATSIGVVLEYGIQELRLQVCDNGRGIDPSILQSGRDGHWGLTGMRERAERAGAKLKVLSSPEHGTEVDLRVPGRVAFESRSSKAMSKAS